MLPRAVHQLLGQPVVIVGNNFAIGGPPTVTMNNQLLSISRYNNTAVEVFVPQSDMGYYDITILNGNGN